MEGVEGLLSSFLKLHQSKGKPAKIKSIKAMFCRVYLNIKNSEVQTTLQSLCTLLNTRLENGKYVKGDGYWFEISLE